MFRALWAMRLLQLRHILIFNVLDLFLLLTVGCGIEAKYEYDGLGGGWILVVVKLSASIGRLELTIALHVGCPQGEVVPQELHDEGGVFVAFLAQSVQLGDGIIECGFS